MAADPSRTARTRLNVSPLEDRVIPSVGGGFTQSGLEASYYANPNLPTEGSAASFVRRDVRIDLDAAAGVRPGGSSSPAFNAVSANSYSVRWAGQVVANFSEQYRFYLTGDEGARVLIRPAGSGAYTTVVDQSGSSTPFAAQGAFNFVAGQSYDIRVEFRQTGGGASLKLEWDSPSSPREVIEPVTDLGINVPAAWSFNNSGRYFADAIKGARPFWFKPGTGAGGGDVFANRDANGWPTEDAELLVWEGAKDNQGTYRLSFKGQARVFTGYGTFRAGGLNYNGELPLNAPGAYNAATDTTTVDFIIPFEMRNVNLKILFANASQGSANGRVGGVRDVSLMRPSTVGGATPYANGTTFTAEYLEVVKRFSVLRTMEASGTNASTVTEWGDRTTPTSWFSQNYFNPNGATTYNGQFNNNGVAWEYLVQLANETGKDLYINLPARSSQQYVRNLANLIRYGSDGTNPYTSQQQNPVYAGLNSNLKVYFEYSNEIWNQADGFAQFQDNAGAAFLAVQAGNEEGGILNFDNLSDSTDSRYLWAMRRAAYQTKLASDIFGEVFGGAAITTRVRPVLGWFNDNLLGTARGMLSFLDTYFNNGNGFAYVDNPKPISSYIWGAGGGSYYTALNADGIQNQIQFNNSGFESPTVTQPGNVSNNPANIGWNFSGSGGVVRAGNTQTNLAVPAGSQMAFLRPGASLSQTVTINQPGVYGLRFQATTGSSRGDLQAGVNVYVNNQLIGTEYPFGPQFAAFGTHYRSDAVPGYFQVNSPGTYTIRFEAASNNNEILYLDEIQLTSSGAIFNAEIPVTNPDFNANYTPTFTGQTRAGYQRGLGLEVNWAKAYGLKSVSYEGGWSLGGINDVTGIQFYAKYNDTDPTHTRQAQNNAINDFFSAGGDLLVLGSFAQWEQPATAAADPLVQAIDDRVSSTKAAATNGIAFTPGQPLFLTANRVTLVPNNYTVGNGQPGYTTTALPTIAAPSNNNFIAWNVLIPPSQRIQPYTINVTSAGRGSFELWVDDKLITTQASSGTLNTNVSISRALNLGSGLHTIRVKAVGGVLRVNSVVMTAGGVVGPQVPNAPTAGQASATSPMGAQVSWVDNANNETGYRVERSTSPNFTTNLVTTNLAANVVSTQVSGLAPSTTYYFRVTAFNDAGASEALLLSATTPGVSAQDPAVPTNFSAAANSATQIRLSFVDAATTETGFVLERSTDQSNWTVVNAFGAIAGSGTTATFDDNGRTAGTTYFYRVRATGASGDSAFAFAQATTAGNPQGAPNTVANGDFETPSIASGTVSTNPSGATWSFNSTSGIVSNGGIPGLPATTSGAQSAFLQGGATPGSFSQTVTITDGDYRLNFRAAGQVPVRVTLTRQSDGQVVRQGTVTPGSSFADQFVPLYTVNAGAYTLRIDTTDGSAANRSLVDAVKLVRLNIEHLAVGNPNPSGDATFDGTTYAVSSGGTLGGTVDQFRIVRQDFSGDAVATAQVAGFDTPGSLNANAKAGVMIRGSDGQNAAFAYAYVTPDRRVAFAYRSLEGTAATLTTPLAVAGSAPISLRVTRRGNQFTASYSVDGVNFTTIGTPQTLENFGTTAKVGLAANSNVSGQLATARFTNYDVSAA